MKTATISETKNQLSAYLDLVKRGETVLILDRDRPVARLVPVEADGVSHTASLADLERRGILRRAARRPGKGFLKSLPPAPKNKVDLLGALLAERDETR